MSPLARWIDLIALTSIVLTLAALIAGPAQHRLVERGDVSVPLLDTIARLAGAARLFFAIVLGCDGFIVTEAYFGRAWALIGGVGAFAVAMALWFGLAWWIRPKTVPESPSPRVEEMPMGEKVKEMLNEAWVMLPGATGIFGFQLVIIQSPLFVRLPARIHDIHFTALMLIALALILLLTPSAVHRLAFHGQNERRSLLIGSRVMSVALAPLAFGITADFFVAAGQMIGYRSPAMIVTGSILFTLLLAWYIAPWAVRAARAHAGRL